MIAVNARAGESAQSVLVRVLFVAANRERLPDPVIPLGILQVLESAREHERAFVDLCFEEDPVATMRASIRDVRPDVVAISMRNLCGSDYRVGGSVAYHRALVDAVREERPSAKIVVGGGGFSTMPRQILDALDADYGVAGEGEVAFPELLAAIDEGGLGAERIGGVCTRDGTTQAPRTWVDLARVPVADRRRVDPRHYERCGIDAVQTKRGCPLTCDYCTYPSIEGAAIRLRPPAHVADEILHVREAAPNASHLFIVDAGCNRPQSHAMAVCDAMIDRETGLPWTCYVNPLSFGPELAAKMVEAGCAGIEVGSDAGSDDVLERLAKGFDTRRIVRTHEIARSSGLKDCHTFILGTPGETLDQVRQTLDFIVDLEPFAAILMVWTDPGREPSKLRDRVLELLDAEKHRHARWIIPELGVRHRARSFALLRRRGLTGPLWQHLS